MNNTLCTVLSFVASFLIHQIVAPCPSGAMENVQTHKSMATHTISVNFDVTNGQLSGTSRITLPAGRPLTLHCGPLTITGSVLKRGQHTPLQVATDAGNTIRLEATDKQQTLLLSWTLPPGNPYATGNLIDKSGITLTGFWHPIPEQDMLYTLRATLPQGFTGISEGEKLAITNKNGIRQLETSFPYPLRALHLAAGPYTIKSRKVGSVTVYSYFFKEDQQLAADYLQAAARYIKRFEELIGSFPYSRYSIVENRLPTGYGMPSFTLLGQAVIRLPFIKDTSLGHEILHSWFGNSINLAENGGNWCEGLTSYLADHSFSADTGKGIEYRKYQLLRYRAYVHPDNEMNLAEFEGAGDNRPIAKKIRAIGYDKGSMLFHMLKKAIGEQAFALGLRDLYGQKIHERASWTDIQEAFSRAAGTDLAPFFQQWLHRADIPKLSMQQIKVEQKDGQSIITFHLVQENAQPYILQVPITVKTVSGDIQKTCTVNQMDQELSITADTLPTAIILDPDYDVLRQLTEPEIPPIWASFLGAENKIVVLPDDETLAATYQPLADILEAGGADVAYASELTNQDLSEASFLFTDDSALKRSLFADPAEPDTGFSLRVRKNPLDLSQTIVLVHSSTRTETKAVLHKLSHYGKYSSLQFAKGKNTEKQIEQAENGIQLDLYSTPAGIPTKTVNAFSSIIQDIRTSRVVYAGETHTAYGDHLLQLQILQALYVDNPNLAIGMEMFPRAAQPVLDGYITGVIETEKDFLKQADYFTNWGYDYRLYRPIIDFAKKHQLPIIGLNLDKKIVSQVFKKGHTDAIGDKDLTTIAADRDLDVPGYRDRLLEVHAMHNSAPNGGNNFSGFLQAQALWDETMAESISDYLRGHPEKQMIIIAGNGHMYKDSGIPLRVQRRIPEINQSVLAAMNGMDTGIDEGKRIDYLMFAQPAELPPSPKVGVILKEEKAEDTGTGDRIRIIDISPHGKAAEAGLEKDDIILSVDDEPVHTITDLKVSLLDKEAGDTVTVEIFRERIIFPDETLELEVELSALPSGGMVMPPGHPKK